jgi:hypothetical protein
MEEIAHFFQNVVIAGIIVGLGALSAGMYFELVGKKRTRFINIPSTSTTDIIHKQKTP